MDKSDLANRSKQCTEESTNKIECKNLDEPLVVVKGSCRIVVKPIWIYPVDEIEGPLMLDYIKKHPRYKSIYLRKSVFEKLIVASNLLPEGLKLIVRAGHRPIEVQRTLLNQLVDKYLQEHPGAAYGKALKNARRYVRDPSITMPPHCCGAAVDIDLLDVRHDKLVDFGCEVNTDNEKAFLFSELITSEQSRNRMMLTEAMLNAGFACYYYEWWHFSYGDQLWACFYDQPKSLYDIIR